MPAPRRFGLRPTYWCAGPCGRELPLKAFPHARHRIYVCRPCFRVRDRAYKAQSKALRKKRLRERRRYWTDRAYRERRKASARATYRRRRTRALLRVA
jgi:hypothetical protein